jgi:hypothetical protein
MNKTLKGQLQGRWSQLEDRIYQLTAILDDLGELEEESSQIDVKKTIAYQLFQKEMKLLVDEQAFIEFALKVEGGDDAGVYKSI